MMRLDGLVIATAITCTVLSCARVDAQSPVRPVRDGGLYTPYVDLGGIVGGHGEVGQTNLMLPLWQTRREMFFADLRGFWTDESAAEGNWGLGFRRIGDDDTILGVYGFYDLRHTEHNNNFSNVTLGIEHLSVCNESRLNVYIPDDDQEAAFPIAFVANNNVFVAQQLEAAYYGADAEYGHLLYCNDNRSCDRELRGYIGGYGFDRGENGYETIAGPRARLEFRVFDLPKLGVGSRLVFGGLYQWDGVRGSQTMAMASLRIPLGRGRRLNRLERRMLNPIVRDLDVVTHVGGRGSVESAKFTHSGNAIADATVVTALDDLSAEVAAAGADSLLILDGVDGVFSEADTSFLNDGQVVMGGGSLLSVTGCDTGTVALFRAPGLRPTVDGTDPGLDVFELADDSGIIGLDITGGFSGIFGDGVTGFLVADNGISGAFDDGLALAGVITGGTIIGNDSSGNGDDGFDFDVFDGGTISGNSASGNDDDGYDFEVFADGDFTGNSATMNDDNGFELVTVLGGTISGNSAVENLDDGFDIDFLIDGTLTANSATGNLDDGFDIEIFDGATVTGNSAAGNDEFGFEIIDFLSGTLGGNTATDNLAGFFIETLDGGMVSGNSALDNDIDGFVVLEFFSGTVGGNTSAMNGDSGYFFGLLDGGMVSDNVATGNEFDGFFVSFFASGSVTGNTALANGDHGFLTEVMLDGSIMSNSASSNGSIGFEVGGFFGGTVGDNTSTGNLAGFLVDTLDGGTLSSNSAFANTIDGFVVLDFFDGSVTGNMSSSNDFNGYFVGTMFGGTMTGNSATGNLMSGYDLTFDGANTATFSTNTATDNTTAGYTTTGTPSVGAGTNTGTGNGSADTF